MDTITADEAHARIMELGLPSVVLTAFEGKPVPEVLQWQMRDPYEIFTEPTAHEVYPPGGIVPLWSDHTGYTIVGIRERGAPLGFLRFGLEREPTEPADIEGLSWQQIVVEDLVQIWEVGDDEELADRALREAATHLRFESVDRLLDALREPARNEDFENWHRAFLQTLPAHP